MKKDFNISLSLKNIDNIRDDDIIKAINSVIEEYNSLDNNEWLVWKKTNIKVYKMKNKIYKIEIKG